MKKIKDLIKTYPYISAAIAVVFVALVGLLVVVRLGNGNEESATTTSLQTVTTIPVSQYASGAVGFFAPTASGNSFVIRAEFGGRVDDTQVKNGQKVTAGQILVRLDGDAQLAALTQAEGAYESALVNAEQSDVSVVDAESDLESAYGSSYTTANNILLNTIDEFFIRPTFGQTPGLWIDGGIKTQFLNNERVAFRGIMSNWQDNTGSIAESPNRDNLSLEAVSAMQRMIGVIDILVDRINKEDNVADVNERTPQSYLPELGTVRSSLVSAINNLEGALQALRKAELSGTGSVVSSSSAQIKQALGSLQAAQAAYGKTIVRAPFDGVISSLNVQVGDILNIGSDVAVITPEDTTDTIQSFNLPLSAVKYTPTGTFVFSVNAEGVIETIEVEAGLVTTNSVTVTGLTGNEIIVEDVRGLKAGDTVIAQ